MAQESILATLSQFRFLSSTDVPKRIWREVELDVGHYDRGVDAKSDAVNSRIERNTAEPLAYIDEDSTNCEFSIVRDGLEPSIDCL